jgi:hypothetical protein
MEADAVRALRGSPLQGLRVSFDTAGTSRAGALGIAPTGMARILRRGGASRAGALGIAPTGIARILRRREGAKIAAKSEAGCLLLAAIRLTSYETVCGVSRRRTFQRSLLRQIRRG